MFYAQFVLSKKGPLAKIWLAAHWEKKLSKQQIFETNVELAVGEIMQPKVKMALRTTGHLLLGIVRIYSRKAKYLLADCNEAFMKIKMAFRPGAVDLMSEDQEAEHSAITLPDVYQDFDSLLPDFADVDNQQFLSFNQSRIDEITLKEDVSSSRGSSFGADPNVMDDFGESAMGGFGGGMMGFDGDNFSMTNMSMERGRSMSMTPSGRMSELHAEMATPIPSELAESTFGDFGDQLFGGVCFANHACHCSDTEGSLFGDSTAASVDGSRPSTAMAPGADETLTMKNPEHDTTLHRDVGDLSGLERKNASKRKRRLIIDEVKNITGDEMKAQMANYGDTIMEWELAPPTRRLMHLKHSNVDRMYTAPSNDDEIISGPMTKIFHDMAVFELKFDAESTSSKIEDLEMVPQEHLSAAWLEQARRESSMATSETHNAHTTIGGIEPEDEPMMECAAPGENDPLAVNLDEVDDRMASPSALEGAFSPREKSKRKAAKLEKAAAAVEEVPEDDGDDAMELGDVEDKRWTRRTTAILHGIRVKLDNADEHSVAFADVSKNATRKTAASKFYTLLVLKKWQAIDVEQDSKAFSEIFVKAGPHIDQQAPSAH